VLAIGRSDTQPVAGPSDRYEPLPGFAELPRWVWRRIGPRVRIGVVVALVLAVGGTVALVPAIDESRRQRAAAERRDREERHERSVRELQAEQRPRFGRAAAPAGSAPRIRLAARAAAIDELSASIVADARRRVQRGDLDGTIRRAECEPFPRSVGAVDPARQLSRRRGRYACIAVTSEFEGGAIGHPYRAMIDFESGRYAFCKISGRPDPTPDPEVTTPRACGG
jgi:hypothetical protein